MKKFYAVIGNPPYQEEVEGNGRQSPIYNYFMDESYKLSKKAVLITPARFLFNAGQTPKQWNKKMLGDTHLKVAYYAPNSERVFPGTEIKGGVAVTYHDDETEHEPVGVFTTHDELAQILEKVNPSTDESIASVVTGAVPYKFSELVRKEHPELLDAIGESFDLRTNVFDKLNGKLFFEDKNRSPNSVAIFGLLNKKRVCLWIDRSYIETPNNFDNYKVLLAKANGDGTYGEKLSEPVIAGKNVGHTQSFISIGNFETEDEAVALVSYVKTKFARALLGVLKVTHDMNPRVWELVPLQDFTICSDIDWSQSVANIDQQLYKKYGLDKEEIEFIETHVQAMD